MNSQGSVPKKAYSKPTITLIGTFDELTMHHKLSHEDKGLGTGKD